MTHVNHPNPKAYWRQGRSQFMLDFNFSDIMSYNRFSNIMKMHVFEVPSKRKQLNDPLYQLRSTIDAFNGHMPSCLAPGRYLVIDESMNQWLGKGMPNLKKVPRKPNPIGQEFKTLADNHTFCILRIDTVSDPKQKEYDGDDGMQNLTATVKRLVKPWFGTGRTVIADSWFGAPDMVSMLCKEGLWAIMQVVRRRYWPQGMPKTDSEPGSYFTMMINQGKDYFVCAFRHTKVKAFISSYGTTTRPAGECVVENQGQFKRFLRPEIVNEDGTYINTVVRCDKQY